MHAVPDMPGPHSGTALPSEARSFAAACQSMLLVPQLAANPGLCMPVQPSVAEALGYIARGSEAVAARAQQAWKEETVAERQRVFRLFEAGLASVFPSEMDVTSYTVTPQLLLCWLEESYLPEHGPRSRTRMRNGAVVCSASHVKSVLAHLSTSFELLGRCGDYSEATQQGNPCQSALVSAYRAGYRRELIGGGIVPGPAVPMTLEKVRALVRYCLGESERAAGNPFSQMMWLRDAVLYLYLWYSWQRGSEGASIRWEQLEFLGSALHVSTGPLKNHQFSTFTGKDVYEELGPSEAEYCIVAQLRRYKAVVEAAGVSMLPDAGHGFVFRAAAKGGKSFSSGAQSCGAIYQRLRVHLSALGIYEGESVHSFRRGGVQHSKAEGVLTVEERRKKGRWRSVATLEHYESAPSKPRFNGSGCL